MSTEIAGPVARALLALLAIQGVPGITAAALAQRLGVSDRAARRYVQTLREADIPIESTPGRYGGYRLGRSFRLPPLMLTTAEALGLLMVVLPGTQSQTTEPGPRDLAVAKILRVLPAPVAATAELLRTVPQARREHRPQPEPELLTRLVTAIPESRRISFRYRLSNSQDRRMTVDPWAVVLRRGLWYLLCWSHTSDARRLLRVDRLDDIRTEHENFTAPPDLDPLAAVEQHLSEGWRHEVVVDFDASIDEVGHWIPRSMGSLERLPDNGCRLTGSTQALEWYVSVLIEVPLIWRIIGGDELRAAARETARRLTHALEPS